MKEKILIVEDERIIAYDIKFFLEKSGYIVIAIVAYGEQAIEKVAELEPDLVLMDVMLKGEMNGIEAAEKIMSCFNIPIIYLTAYSDEITLQKAKSTQPFGYILKPFDEIQLMTTIEIALNKHKTEKVMREALEKEKEMRELNSRFVSIVSHEFRNPLNTIFNSTELLANHSHLLTEAKRIEYICYIQNAVKHMTQLMSDILLINKTEISKFKFNPAPLDVEFFCRELVQEIQISHSNNHKIIFSAKGKSTQSQDLTQNSQLLCLDEKLLRQILSNLLINAIKYSPQDSTVWFDIFYLQKEAIFRIQDEGIGIPNEDQENLFSSFYRGSNVGKIPGNGLGLSIVKQYVELHGGEITFASKVGVGTTFIVSLPCG